jgi:hypothetical protein
MFKKILIGLVLIVVVFVIVVAMQPSEFHVSRSAKMAAPPAEVFAQVNDFHKWEAWSPWEKKDPNMKRTFSDPAAGKDAKYGWSGNSDVGEGAMTILESRPNELIKIKLDFIKPMEDTSTVEFAFKPEGEQTEVTWSMYGKSGGFIQKAFCLFMNMDKMVGGDFEKGLASIKTIVEKTDKT